MRTRRAAARLLQGASPLRHRMVRNTRELLRRYNLPVRASGDGGKEIILNFSSLQRTGLWRLQLGGADH